LPSLTWAVTIFYRYFFAERGRLDDAAQIRDQRRVPARQMPPAATLAALPAFRQGRGVEVW
jgi:hypothetical protein